MGFLRNRNAGKLKQLKGEQERLSSRKYLTEEEEKRLSRIEYKIGVREEKQISYQEKANKQKVVNKFDNSRKNYNFTNNASKSTKIGIIDNTTSDNFNRQPTDKNNKSKNTKSKK